MRAFDEAGVVVYALSYDEGDALQDFGNAHGISYALLSDPESEVIRSFGILNTLIDSNDHPWFGIPYPGAYVVSADGVITHKFFDNNLALRAGPEQLLRAALGETLAESVADEGVAEAVGVSVELDGEHLALTVLKDLVVRFSVPKGRHVYAHPAPYGTVAALVTLDDNERLVHRDIVRPASEPHTLAGTEESFRVHHGQFELRLPLAINRAARGDEDITVSGEVRWQSCDDEVCDIPTSQRFELIVPISETPPVALRSKRGAALEPNARAHFQKMSERRRHSG